MLVHSLTSGVELEVDDIEKKSMASKLFQLHHRSSPAALGPPHLDLSAHPGTLQAAQRPGRRAALGVVAGAAPPRAHRSLGRLGGAAA